MCLSHFRLCLCLFFYFSPSASTPSQHRYSSEPSVKESSWNSEREEDQHEARVVKTITSINPMGPIDCFQGLFTTFTF